jgi:hypothetical protein
MGIATVEEKPQDIGLVHPTRGKHPAKAAA